MRKLLFLFFIILISLMGCSASKDSQQNVKSDELINRNTDTEENSNIESKKTLSDLSEYELKQLVANPKETDRDLLLEYISKVETDSFYFTPLKEGEELDYKLITHRYFNSLNNRIVTNEIIIYKKTKEGALLELKHFARAGRIKGTPEEIPKHLYFYINDVSDTYGLYLWEIDGEKGIGQIILTESGYRVLSNNGKYLFKEEYVKHIFDDKEQNFPLILVYSLFEKKIIKEYDLFDTVKEDLTEGDFIDGLYYKMSKNGDEIIAELGSMGSILPTFLIDQNTLEISRLK